jgi:hypothetical protein
MAHMRDCRQVELSIADESLQADIVIAIHQFTGGVSWLVCWTLKVLLKGVDQLGALLQGMDFNELRVVMRGLL